ncbi:hypothetical protein ABH922_004966 [Rhodococcus sp. 27YEA15]
MKKEHAIVALCDAFLLIAFSKGTFFTIFRRDLCVRKRILLSNKWTHD